MQEAEALGSVMPRLVSQLLEAGKTDTVYRDLYLQRARTFFAPLLPYPEYLHLEQEKISIDNLLRQNRAAVERGEWSTVQELSSRIRALRHIVEGKRSLLELGQAIYEVSDVPLDPFSPGFQTLFAVAGQELMKVRERVVEHLAALEREDPSWQSFYASRHTYFQTLSPAALESSTQATRPDPGQLRREALQALDKGDLDHLERLAQEMLKPTAPPQVAVPTPHAVPATQMGLSVSFSDETLAGARRLGLVPARVGPDGEFYEYLSCCCVWRATFPDRPLTEGGKRIKGCTCGHACPPSIPPALKENLDLLMVHPFINSGGARYLPRFAAEHVLIEDFSEEEAHTQHSELLSALGLKKRTAVSRLEIEQALLQHGPHLVKDELQLDPREFCLLCVSFDVYRRLGPARRWGRQRFWTHFDGYQVLEGGKLRALVGGDARYDGIYDLCSISRADEREGVTTRFAVVRRERLVAV